MDETISWNAGLAVKNSYHSCRIIESPYLDPDSAYLLPDGAAVVSPGMMEKMAARIQTAMDDQILGALRPETPAQKEATAMEASPEWGSF